MYVCIKSSEKAWMGSHMSLQQRLQLQQLEKQKQKNNDEDELITNEAVNEFNSFAEILDKKTKKKKKNSDEHDEHDEDFLMEQYVNPDVDQFDEFDMGFDDDGF